MTILEVLRGGPRRDHRPFSPCFYRELFMDIFWCTLAVNICMIPLVMWIASLFGGTK